MTSRRENNQDRVGYVFINCPFDLEYRPLFRAMCFAILRCGYTPRCALDFSDSGETRFHKILDLIVGCGQSIHDISRVQLDDHSRMPRFNMPLELGADLGLRLKGPQRQRDRRLLILETEQHRYDITASDLSGQDIEAHHDSELQIIARVRDWLNAGRPGERPLPGAETIQASPFPARAGMNRIRPRVAGGRSSVPRETSVRGESDADPSVVMTTPTGGKGSVFRVAGGQFSMSPNTMTSCSPPERG